MTRSRHTSADEFSRSPRRTPMSQPEQDPALLPLPAQGQIAVDQRSLPLVGQQAPPPPQPSLRRIGSDRPPTSCTARSSQSTGTGASRSQRVHGYFRARNIGQDRRSVAGSRARRERGTARPQAGGWCPPHQQADEWVPTTGAGDDDLGAVVTCAVRNHPSLAARRSPPADVARPAGCPGRPGRPPWPEPPGRAVTGARVDLTVNR